MATLDERLVAPLRKIAVLAVREECNVPDDPQLDLFRLRNVLQQERAAAVAFVRAEIERLSGGGRSLRTISPQVLRSPAGMGAIHCVVCPASTPEDIQRVGAGMFVFAICGSDPGYMPID